MFSATDFLPLYMTMLMKRAMVSLPCFGSGSTERCGVFPLRDMALFSLGRALARRFFPVAGQDPPYESTRSEEHTSELQSLMRISYAVFCLKKKKKQHKSK